MSLTLRGPFENGDFWSDLIFGDTATVEFEPGEEHPFGDPKLPFAIPELSHLYEIPIAPRSRPTDSAQVDTVPPNDRDYKLSSGVSSEHSALTQVGACHFDANCFSDELTKMNSVALLLFERPDGTHACSGVLVNNPERQPYILTANHCVNDDSTARSLKAYWFYQTPACGGVPPDLSTLPNSTGQKLLVGKSYSDGDFSLIAVNSAPPGVTYAGFTTTEPLVGGLSMVGIHHPGATFKRISSGRRVADQDTVINGGTCTGSALLSIDLGEWSVGKRVFGFPTL